MPSECEDNSHAQRSGQYRYIITHASLTYAAEGGTALALRASQPSCCTGGSVHALMENGVCDSFVRSVQRYTAERRHFESNELYMNVCTGERGVGGWPPPRV